MWTRDRRKLMSTSTLKATLRHRLLYKTVKWTQSGIKVAKPRKLHCAPVMAQWTPAAPLRRRSVVPW